MPAKATATTETFSPPESVTIPGEIALEALALLDAYANLMADFRVDGDPDTFYRLEEPIWSSFLEALGHKRGDDLNGPLIDAMDVRSEELKNAVRSLLDGQALGAIAMIRAAHDIAALEAALKYRGVYA